MRGSESDLRSRPAGLAEELGARLGQAVRQSLVPLDLAATARASFSVYSTREDIARLMEGLREVQRLFGGE